VRHGARRAYAGYERLAEDPEVDIVYVATPHAFHCEHALLCLEHGKSVLVEKPFALDAAQARRMVETARRNRVFLMEGMWSRFLPATRCARDLVAAGEIGEPRMVSADFSFGRPLDPASRLLNPALGGGGLLDVGIYPLAFTSLFFGPHPLETASFAHLGPTGVDEHAALLLRYEGGRIASLTCGVQAVGPYEAHVLGSSGRISLPAFAKAESVHLVRPDRTQDFSFPFLSNGFEYEIAEVMTHWLAGDLEHPDMTLDETVALLEIMDRMRRSWGLVYPGEQEVR
jgi:predicted dehydrogenase